jgi:hypothetical protein
MKWISNRAAGESPDFPLIPPVAVVLSLGMMLPEYWLIAVAGALVAIVSFAAVQRVFRSSFLRRGIQTSDAA